MVRIILIIPAVLLVCVLILVGVLLASSPGKPKPYLDENGGLLEGSISEKTHVNINGVEQGMFIKSKNKANPVLLFIHGGPGMPEYFLFEQSAHSPLFEEPGKVRHIIKEDILAGVNNLADIK